MTQDDLKALVGQAAIAHVEPGSVIGVGTGTTVNCFIDALAAMPVRIRAAVSSSVQSTARMRALGIEVRDANEVDTLAVYIDGADEIDGAGFMIKGGGAALTREKVVADLSARFVCIADASKLVQVLGRFPVPVEVLPMAVNKVARQLAALGGRPVQRAGVVTDNGGVILDVAGLVIADPVAWEREIGQLPGVIGVGIFARNKASVCLLGTPTGVKTLTF